MSHKGILQRCYTIQIQPAISSNTHFIYLHSRIILGIEVTKLQIQTKFGDQILASNFAKGINICWRFDLTTTDTGKFNFVID